MVKRYLWHCTKLDCLDKILREGIRVNNPTQRKYKPKGVYLSEYKFNWMWNTKREGIFKGATIKIDVEGLKIIKDFHRNKCDTKYNSKRIGKDFICLSDIPLIRIKEVLIETEPNNFQPIK